MHRWIGLLLVLAACSSGSSAVGKSLKTPDRIARIIAEQTRLYERAGVSHADAACLANVTGRTKSPGREGALIIASRAQQRAINRCNMEPGALAKIGAYLRKRFPALTTTTAITTTTAVDTKIGMCFADPIVINDGTTAPASSTTLYCP